MTTFEIDQQIRGDGPAILAPPGTVVRTDSGYEAIKGIDGWTRLYDHNADSHYSRVDPGVITYVGTEVEETVAQFKQRFATTGWGAAYANSVVRDPLVPALASLGIDEAYRLTLREGMSVHSADRDLLRVIPDGTLLIGGDHTLHPSRSGLYVVQSGVVTAVLGREAHRYHATRKVLMFPPGVETEPWPEETDDLLAVKRRAHDIGMAAKAEASWCGVAEETLRSCGLWPGLPSADGGVYTGSTSIGDHVTRSTARSLPEGSVLESTDSGRWFVRLDDPGDRPYSQQAGTVGVTDRDRRSSARMIVHSIGHATNNPDFVVADAAQMDMVPTGSMVEDSGYYWIKAEDGRWATATAMQVVVPREGESRSSNFGFNHTTLRWHRVCPVPEEELF